MGDVCAFVLAIGAMLIGLGLLLGLINYKIDKLKDEDKLNIDIRAAIIALEKAVKKLNAALRSHDRRLDNHIHEISDIKNRLDILEAGHPDTDIDYGTVDDDVDPLLKRAERLDYLYSTGLISIATYRRMIDELVQKELMQNDT